MPKFAQLAFLFDFALVILCIVAVYHALFLRTCFRKKQPYASVRVYAVSVYIWYALVVTGAEFPYFWLMPLALFAVAFLQSWHWALIPFAMINWFIYIPYDHLIGLTFPPNIMPLLINFNDPSSEVFRYKFDDFISTVAWVYLYLIVGYACCVLVRNGWAFLASRRKKEDRKI